MLGVGPSRYVKVPLFLDVVASNAGVGPPRCVEVPLFLDVVASNAGVVVVLDGAALQCKPVDNDQRQAGVTLADVLVTVASQSRRVAAIAALKWLQTLPQSTPALHPHSVGVSIRLK